MDHPIHKYRIAAGIKTVIKYSSIFVIFFISIILPAQVQIKFRHINLEDGLSNNVVNCFLRDSRGLLWIGTQNGLNRYDGYNFTIYRSDINNPNSIKSNWISDIVEDKKGYIWIATSNGTLSQYDYKLDRFKAFNILSDKTRSDSFYLMIKDLHIDTNDNLWIAVVGEGLFKYNRSKDNFTNFKANGLNNSISSNLVSSITHDSKGAIWVLTNDGILNKLDPVLNTFKKIPYTDNFIGNPMSILSDIIYSDSNDRIFIGTQMSGFYIYDQGKSIFYHFYNIKNTNSLSNNTVTGIVEDEKNKYWISTDHGGLNLFDFENKHFTIYTHDQNNRYTLSNNQIYTIYKDYENIYWLGNYLGGVDYFINTTNYFDNYGKTNDKNGLSNSSVLAFIERDNGELWIGTDGGGINILYPAANNTYTLNNNPPINTLIKGDVIVSLLEDSKGRIWIGTYLKGLNRYDPKTGKVKLYYPDKKVRNTITSSSIWSMFEDSKGRIWIGTLSSGLLLYNEESDTFYQFPYDTNNSGTSGRTIYYIYEDSNKQIWIAPAGTGLDKFCEQDSTFINYLPILKDSKSLSSEGIQYIYEDSHSNLWIGTLNGLNIFDRKTESFSHITINDGLPNNSILGILEDNNDNLWISTLNGICKYNPLKKTTRNYFEADGLQSFQFIYKSCLKTKKGKLFFGGIGGVTSFYPDSIKINKHLPRVLITDFKLFNKSVEIGPGSTIKENILIANEINLRYNENFIGFNFVAIEYLHQDKINYAYYMEGLEENWNYVGNLRTASYTGLKPGKYVFHVKAISIGGTSIGNSANIKIIINPPFWQTWLFRIIVLFLILSLLYTIYIVRINRFKRQKILLEKIVAEKTSELSDKNIMLSEQTDELNEANTILEERQNQMEEQSKDLVELNNTKDRFFSIIAHDLKNPFVSILGFSEILKSKSETLSKEKRDKYIDAIYNSSKALFNLLENLLLWAKSQSKHIIFKPKNIQIKGIIESNILLQRESIKKKNIHINSDVLHDFSIYADKDMIDTIIRNLLSNAIKFTPVEGTIKINCWKKDGYSSFCISDTGKGISIKVINDLFRIDKSVLTEGTEGEKGTGLGLILCKEFIEIQNGRITVESKEGKGSSFIFSLPDK